VTIATEIPRSAWVELAVGFDCHSYTARRAIADELMRLGDDFAAGLAAALMRRGRRREPNPVSRALARA
jgi:hypothetical protein